MLNTRTIQNTFPGIASDLEEGTERQLQSREEVGASLRSVLSCKVEVETHRTAQPHAAVLRALSPSAPAPRPRPVPSRHRLARGQRSGRREGPRGGRREGGGSRLRLQHVNGRGRSVTLTRRGWTSRRPATSLNHRDAEATGRTDPLTPGER